MAGLSILAGAAGAQVRIVPAQPASAAKAADGVDIFVVNESGEAAPVNAPDRITVTAADGTRLTLEPDGEVTQPVAAGGFVKLRYRPVAAPTVATTPPLPTPVSVAPKETVVSSSTGSSSGIFDRFEPHEPIYGAFGTDDAGAKLQFSFAFRPFERAGALDGLRFGYTQTMFWALDEPSAPFRSTIYSPEVYYERDLGEGVRAAAGYRHDSNGGGEFDSVDVNRIFVRAAKRFDLGGDWHADIAPEAWFYVGKLSREERISDYWGYTALRASIEQDDGIKLALYARGNPGTGRGGAELFASYPLAKLGGGLGIYLFGQAFTGYGEALDDYRLSDSHARLGISLTR